MLAINGRSVDSVARLRSRLDDYAVNDTVRLTQLRPNSEGEVTVKLEAGSQ
jgi:S1-C subfamily serine protease